MPNITSVDVLQNLYLENKNIFVVLLIDYNPKISKNIIQKVHFLPIEFISWESLTIGALGVGQIQIKNASNILEITHNSRKNWMREFCERLTVFYNEENKKLSNWIINVNENRLEWENTEDIWKID